MLFDFEKVTGHPIIQVSCRIGKKVCLMWWDLSFFKI